MEATYTEGELDLNERVESADFLTLASNFGSTTAAAVPEPSTSLMLTTLAIIFIGCRGTAIDILGVGNVQRRNQSFIEKS